jgi:hypothetical protein
MRMLLKAEFPVETFNAKVKQGKAVGTLQAILEELKPEAAYFVALEGKRTALLFIDISDPSQIPAVCEPWFHAFGASVDLIPAMLPQDLMKAGPAIEQAIKKFG